MGQDFTPEIVILYCQHCVAEDADLNGAMRQASGFKPRLVVMPCTSKVEVSHLIKILEQGTDGVQVVGCLDGGCQFLMGSSLAQKRVEYARRFLDELSFGADRLGMHRGEGLSADEVLALAENRAQAVNSLGANPMKKIA